MRGSHPATHADSLILHLMQETVEDRVCHAYEKERGTIYRYLVSLGVGRASAQDLTQEAFLRMYVAVRKGGDIQNVRAWLFTVASRLALDLQREAGRRPWVHDGDEEPMFEGAAAQNVSPELALLRREQLAGLRDAVRQLSPQQRVCLHLRAEGFRYRAIADILGVGVPTVAEHLRRALARLRQVLNE
jgi:RNA polymerase sigma-70 factor, ECF subfamily